MIAVSIAMAIWTSLLVWMHVRTEKRREIEATETTIGSKDHGLGAIEHDRQIRVKAEKV